MIGALALLPLPPDELDLEIGWQLAPGAWGKGYAAEAGHAVAHYAFTSGADEIFAVVRPRNARGAATARRVGMEWVGETDKYYALTLQVYGSARATCTSRDPPISDGPARRATCRRNSRCVAYRQLPS